MAFLFHSPFPPFGDENKPTADNFAGEDHPKLKFNFTILFEFVSGGIRGSENPFAIDFGVKQATRPQPNVVYEDVNFYNFMTKVATRVDFGVMTVTLYDDVNNRAHDIFKDYIETISPVTKVSKDSAGTLDLNGLSTSSTLGVLEDNERHGPLKNIRLRHIFRDGKGLIYDFLNPKIQSAILDELDMTQSDVTTITLTFVYDSFNVIKE